MTDTGSEVAQDLARSAAVLATRALDRAIADARADARMRERASAGEREEATATATGDALPWLNREGVTREEGTTLYVLPADGVEPAQRAEELEAALAARGATGVDVTLTESGRAITLTVPDKDAARTVQDTLEALDADTASTFSLRECLGLSNLERVTSRVTTSRADASREHVLVSFAGTRGEEQARAYVAALSTSGFDATYRELPQADGATHAVAVSYPPRRQLDFTCANARVLADLNATARLSPIQGKEETHARDDAQTLAHAPEHEPTSEYEHASETEPASDSVPTKGQDEPREHVMAIFSGDAAHDREHATAYAAAMRERGYDPWHAAMGAGDAVHHTVELSYPASRRDRFCEDHVRVLDEIGAGCEVDVLEEPQASTTSLQDLIAAHMADRETRAYHAPETAEHRPQRQPRRERERDAEAPMAPVTPVAPVAATAFVAAPMAVAPAATPPVAATPATPAKTARAAKTARTREEQRAAFVAESAQKAAGGAREAAAVPGERQTLSARDYLALPARERARIPYGEIPGGAFGCETVADVARQARSGAAALERGRDRKIVPSIGERG